MNTPTSLRRIDHLRPLLWKEWRDTRTATLVVAALTTPVALAAAWLDVYAKSAFSPELVVTAAVPALLALWLALVASDLFSRDTSTRRIEALGLLPTGLRTVWTAKLAYVASGSVALGAWGVVQLWLGSWLFGLPRGLTETADLALGSPLAQAGLLLFTGLLVFASTTGLRGFASVGVAVVGVGLAVYAGLVWPWADWGLPPTGTVPLAAALVVTTGLVLASAFGFVRGRAHRGRTAVVAGLAVVALGCVLVPSGVAAALVVGADLELPHGDPETRLVRLRTLPDGHHVALELRRVGTTHTHRVRTLRIADGQEFDTTPVGHRLADVHAPDLLEVQRLRHTPTGERVVVETLAVDPTGREQAIAGDASRTVAPRQTPGRLADHVWHLSYRDGDNWRYRRVLTASRPVWLTEGTVLYLSPDGPTTTMDLHSGETRPLTELVLDSAPTPDDVAPDGRLILLAVGDSERVHATVDLAPVADLDGTGWRWLGPGHLVRSVGARWELYRLADGSIVDLGPRPCPEHRVAEFVDVLPDGRLVVTRPDDVLWLLDADGAPLRELIRLRGE